MCKKTETRNLKDAVAFFFYFCCALKFCASSTTGISIYSGTITGKIVLNLNRSMKDLFFVRLHTLILCPNFLDAQKGRDTKLKKDATSYNHAEPAWTRCSLSLLVMKVGMINLYINYYRVLTLYFFCNFTVEDSKMRSLCMPDTVYLYNGKLLWMFFQNK